MVFNYPWGSFDSAVAFGCQLLLHNYFVFGRENPQPIVLEADALDCAIYKLLAEPDIFQLESIKCGHIVLLESIFILVDEIRCLQPHRGEINVVQASPWSYSQAIGTRNAGPCG